MRRLAGCVVLGLLLVLTATAAAQDATPTASYVTYTVVPGDTLAEIARRFGVTPRDLMIANLIADPDRLFSGTVLRIPTAPLPTASPTLAPTSTVTLTPAATATATTPPPSIGFELGSAVLDFSHADDAHDAGVKWVALPLRYGVGDALSRARAAIEQAHSSDFKILLQITGSSQALADDAAAYYDEFAAYLGAVAALAPDAIQVWDSMNVEESWARGLVGPAAYTQLLSAAFRAIKTVNPDVLVISGGLAQTRAFNGRCSGSGCDDLPYLRGMAASGAGQYADCIGINYTIGATPPDATSGDPRGDQFLYYYPALMSTYAAIFPDKPLCLTRFGYGADTPAEDAAAWLARAAELASLSGRVRLMIIDDAG